MFAGRRVCARGGLHIHIPACCRIMAMSSSACHYPQWRTHMQSNRLGSAHAGRATAKKRGVEGCHWAHRASVQLLTRVGPLVPGNVDLVAEALKKRCGHIEQAYGFSPVYVRSCRGTWLLSLTRIGHIEQAFDVSPVWPRLCTVILRTQIKSGRAESKISKFRIFR